MANKTTTVAFKLHPRVFAALGSDLVTNDFVAITELVKNSYDAFADRVDVSFGCDDEVGDYIEIVDNGSGMSRETVENVWCVVATPHRAKSPNARKGERVRRVAGEKGLGRLSMARLGDHLEMVTKARTGPALKVIVDWSSLSGASDLAQCVVNVDAYEGPLPFEKSGTRLRISTLYNDWEHDQIDELRDHLSRLLSPFSEVDDFEIRLSADNAESTPTEIESPKFLQQPKYRISGSVDDDGSISCTYTYKPIDATKVERRKTFKLGWKDVVEQTSSKRVKALEKPECGPFKFEVRAWDIGQADTDEIAERFEIKKNLIRSAIRAHKGVSVYRDGILVLPKSESSRDWLGLDLRRVSELGTRLSTSQIIGYVSVSAEENPRIKDTSDRERLVDSVEVGAFEEVIKTIVGAFEQERLADRLEKKTAEAPLKNLFAGLSAEPLVEKVSALAKGDATAKQALPFVTQFEKSLSETRHEIERRFIYYSRLATIGTLAQMLVHEVRNKTTTVGSLLSALAESKLLEDAPAVLREKYDRADVALSGLDRLAETFAPLASRSFGRGRRTSVLEDRINGALALHDVEIKKREIKTRFTAKTETVVAVDPGELDAVLLNLLDNAIYWLSQEKTYERALDIRLSRIQSGARVRVAIHDSGPGVSDENSEKIFWPGVTTKPAGIGMGLTIASEIVDAYDGKMALQQPGELGGASFVFDLPVKQN